MPDCYQMHATSYALSFHVHRSKLTIVVATCLALARFTRGQSFPSRKACSERRNQERLEYDSHAWLGFQLGFFKLPVLVTTECRWLLSPAVTVLRGRGQDCIRHIHFQLTVKHRNLQLHVTNP